MSGLRIVTTEGDAVRALQLWYRAGLVLDEKCRAAPREQ